MPQCLVLFMKIQTWTLYRDVELLKQNLIYSHMGGIDLSNNLFACYSTARNKMKKFYIKMLSHLLDTLVLNLYLTYKKLGLPHYLSICFRWN